MRAHLRLSLSSASLPSSAPVSIYSSNAFRTSFSRAPRPSGTPVIYVQRRGISQRFIMRMREAEIQWQQQAREIKEGTRQSFLSMLEERGLVKNYVGYDIFLSLLRVLLNHDYFEYFFLAHMMLNHLTLSLLDGKKADVEIHNARNNRDAIDKIFTERRIGLYAGVDPTAPSLHVGHLLPFMILAWAYVHGMPAVFLLGGATSSIGDPTDRLTAREQMRGVTRKQNMVNMHMQLKKLGVSIERYGAKYGYEREWVWRRAVENNSVWHTKLPFVQVLKLMGHSTRIGPMLGRDSVKHRMEKGDGISYAEFSYPLMQAWDFWHLYIHDVLVQVGGADQEGNILFGTEAINKMVAEGHLERTETPTKRAFNQHVLENKSLPAELCKPSGITTPLLTTSTGEKFGKSAGNAIWLDKDMTSVFDLYQFFVRLPDNDVEKYLKMFTFMPLPKISEIMAEHSKDTSKRVAQHALALDFVDFIHGSEEAIKAQEQHRALFTRTAPSQEVPQGSRMSETHPLKISASPHVVLPRSLVIGQFFHKILWSAGLVKSKAEAFRLIVNNGASVGSKSDGTGNMDNSVSYTPIRTWSADATEKFILEDSLLILRVGKWKVKVVKIISDEEFDTQGLDAPGWNETETMHDRLEDEKLMTEKRRIGRHTVRPPKALSDSQDGKS
ncbi:tyrosine-tRNA ligase [Polytolypa hystricis UAMH7299]|uniref:Tyrosine--tRNA ligase n=1 Tax=Polytolypa hystricis (strain UAMH7299) TaxID=1447883 RepID=A0A2B7Y027_POLH7|nr:tyrosine-tRNA ligase [Polytolypa hystricis UAMH7299]